MAFWDEHVGVFVASPATGDIEPRSRVFAEAGEAMWVARQAPRTRGEWISAALADDDHREQVVLAAGLSADVVSDLIESARQAADPAARSRGLLWAADATAGGAQPTAESLADPHRCARPGRRQPSDRGTVARRRNRPGRNTPDRDGRTCSGSRCCRCPPPCAPGGTGP